MIDAIKIGQVRTYIGEEMQYQVPKCIRIPGHERLDTLFEKSDSTQEQYPVYTHAQEVLSELKDVKQEEEQLLNIDEETLLLLQHEGYDVEQLEGKVLNRVLKDIKNVNKNIKNVNERQETPQDERETLNYKIRRLKEHTDSMYANGLQKEGTLSINDLYKGSFTGMPLTVQGTYTKQDIQSVLHMNALSINKGNEWAAEKLMGLGIDISQGSVAKVQNIQAAIEGLESFEEGQRELEELTARKEDDPLLEDNRLLYDKNSIEQIKKDLAEVEDQTIQEVIQDGDQPSIQNLREKMLKNTKQVAEKTKHSKTGESQHIASDTKQSTIKEAEVDEIKQQINEIRVRLNTETAQRLSTRMPLESTELIKVANELKQIEALLQEEALLQADVQVTGEHKQVLKQVMDATYKMEQFKEATVGIQIEALPQGSLEQIQEALSLYEEHFSEAKNRFGESVQSIEAQIEEFLEMHQMPSDEASVQSAKALILNGMDLTPEGLAKAKEVLGELNEFLEVMTPYEAAKLIKEGVNPYKASVTTLLEWSKQEGLKQTKETVAQVIVALEEKGHINTEQKQSLIGLYKILNGVVQNKEQVAGYLFKNELPLTIEQLQEAVQYAPKKAHIEAEIDDQYGHLESLEYKTKTARALIGEASKELKKLLEAVKMTESMPLTLGREDVDDLTALKSMLIPFVKGSVKQALGKFDGIHTLPESLLEKIEVIKGTSSQVLETMKAHKIPLTISNIYWIDQIVKDPECYQKLLKETGVDQLLKDKALPEKMDELETVIEELREENRYYKESSMEQGDILNYKSYKQLEEMLEVQKQLMDKEGMYQIPYMVDGETKLVQFYVNKQSQTKDIEKEGLTGVMRYETKALGTITTYFTIKEGHIGYEMRTQSKQAAQALESEKVHLQQLFKQLGYQVMREDCVGENQVEVPIASLALKGESKFEAII